MDEEDAADDRNDEYNYTDNDYSDVVEWGKSVNLLMMVLL